MAWIQRLSCVALFATLALPAFATEVTHVDLRELTLGSSDIVIGRVEGARSRWNEAHTKIVTDVTVRVSERLKGAGSDRLTLVQLGGVVGNMRYTVPGSPAFTPGEESLLFVWRDSGGRAQVNALAQGKFDIQVDAAGRRTVQRRIAGVGAQDVRSLRLVRPGVEAPALPLDEMVREIRRTIEEGGR